MGNERSTTSDEAACTTGGRCTRCETVPGAPDGTTLVLWPPAGHVYGKVRKALRAQTGGESLSETDGALLVQLEAGRADDCLRTLCRALTARERMATSSWLGEVGDFNITAASEVRTLETLHARRESEWLAQLLRDERLTSWFMPIADAQSLEVIGYEMLCRGIDAEGAVIPPLHLFGAARCADLLFQLDLAARRAAIRAAAVLPGNAAVFINFSPAAIYDPEYCLRSTVAYITEIGIDPSRIVFEVVESDTENDIGHLETILHYYRSAGFRVALDDVGAGFSSLERLARLKPDIVKFDRSLISDVDRDPYKSVLLRHLLKLTDELSVTTVAEGIERREELEWCRAHGATWVQGWLFGKPSVDPLPPSFV